MTQQAAVHIDSHPHWGDALVPHLSITLFIDHWIATLWLLDCPSVIIGLPLYEVGKCRKTLRSQYQRQRAFLSSFLQNIPKGWDSPASAMPSLQLFSTYRGSKQWGCHETLYWQQLFSNSLTSFNSRQKDLNVLMNIYPLPKIYLFKLVISHNICLIIVPISYHRQKRKLVYNQSISKADQKLGHKFVQWKWTCLLLTHLIQCSICKFGSAPQFLIDWLDLVRGNQPNRSESSSWSLVFTQKGGWLRVRQMQRDRANLSSSHM